VVVTIRGNSFTFVNRIGTESPTAAFVRQNKWGIIVPGRNYLTRQMTTLLKFAQSTSDPKLVAALVEKAVDLRSQLDERTAPADRGPHAPDVEPPV
jgi:hypothetical protein